MQKLKNIFFELCSHYRQILSYLFFSFLAAVVDILTGYLLLKLCALNIIAVNTAGIVISTGLHYFLVTRKTFNSKISFASLSVYLATFFIGILFQDLIIWLFYDIILAQIFIDGRFLCSKAISLILSFFFLFYIRKKLYNMLNIMQLKKQDNKQKENI